MYSIGSASCRPEKREQAFILIYYSNLEHTSLWMLFSSFAKQSMVTWTEPVQSLAQLPLRIAETRDGFQEGARAGESRSSCSCSLKEGAVHAEGLSARHPSPALTPHHTLLVETCCGPSPSPQQNSPCCWTPEVLKSWVKFHSILKYDPCLLSCFLTSPFLCPFPSAPLSKTPPRADWDFQWNH